MYDVIPHYFECVIDESHHTFYSPDNENCSVETVFTHTNVHDDNSENYSDH